MGRLFALSSDDMIWWRSYRGQRVDWSREPIGWSCGRGYKREDILSTCQPLSQKRKEDYIAVYYRHSALNGSGQVILSKTSLFCCRAEI
jgi:hypothetical protein